MLGLGIGLSTVDPLGDGTPAASSLGIGAGLWFVLSIIVRISSAGATAVVWEGAGSRPGWRPGATGVAFSGLNLYSLLVATVGAVVVLWLYHALVGRRVV
jgi:uncharacterized membrane protein YeaQ/YmgE (transglycosylase-associated protein family)